MNVCFETFGCRLNRAEALEDEAKCLAVGHQVVTSHKDADFFVVRGCSVTARAQRDCERLIAHLRKHYPNKRIHVTGCLKDAKPFIVKEKSVTPVPTRTARAYLKVQDGCAGECTFCIVPAFRGKSASVEFDKILDRAKRFIDAGYREIVVTGCNLSLYADSGKRLPELVAALAGLDPCCRIRLGSLEPFLTAEATIDAMAAHENVCRFLHLPIQSASDRILQLMKRPYTIDRVESLINRARKLMPSVGIGCDMLAGFPGESEQDHRSSEMFIGRHKLFNVHAFPFSPRPGTPAASMPGKLPHELVSRRAKALAKIGENNRHAFAKRFVGKDVEVVIEGDRNLQGWTGEYLWFEELNKSKLKNTLQGERRSLIRFRVQEAHGGRLCGVRSAWQEK